MSAQPCPCQSGLTYADCCRPLHQGMPAADAEKLMRSRYAAFVLQNIDYIVHTTVPVQQPLLDAAALAQWAAQTEWLGLDVLRHEPNAGEHHALVEFAAYFADAGGKRETRTVGLRTGKRPLVFHRPYRTSAIHEIGLHLRFGQKV